MSEVLHLTNENFDKEVVQSAVPVVVDFFATWCGPCKMVGPVMEELAREYGDKVRIGKVDVDEAGDVAAKFSIRGVPTIMFFKAGAKVSQLVGAFPKDKLKVEIDKLL